MGWVCGKKAKNKYLKAHQNENLEKNDKLNDREWNRSMWYKRMHLIWFKLRTGRLLEMIDKNVWGLLKRPWSENKPNIRKVN